MNFPLEIIARTGKSKTEIIKEENDVCYLNAKGKPVDNEANIEIVKFFSKLTGRKVKIAYGLKSKRKVVDFL